ncbi:hypothetical protein BP5796_11525 [Coleophoma crateriformis]|uniref:Cupin 2 conserved barrel domain-containing protein n=1 Tax=Coleophoma crateriformis TaxID=565419 RepID=A0A3D8QIH3_9HELO|nr:hypothetical protein BP5796_11525 [Coleophoma crateriformis]
MQRSARTVTRDRLVFDFPEHGGLAFPTPASGSQVVTIRFHARSTARTGLHWHESHTEYVRVVRGVAQVTLGRDSFPVRASDGMLTIPRGVWHEYGRAVEAEGEGELVLEEWTEPEDGLKWRFFRNVLGVIADSGVMESPGAARGLWTLWQLLVVFSVHDNYPVLVKQGGFLSRWLTYSVLWLAHWSGWVVGLKGSYEEYVSEDASGSEH